MNETITPPAEAGITNLLEAEERRQAPSTVTAFSGSRRYARKLARKKRMLVIVAALVGLLALGSGAASPFIVNGAELARASSAFELSEERLSIALAELKAAEHALATAQRLAAERYIEGKAFQASVAPEFVALTDVLTEYDVLLTVYAETAQLHLDEAGNVVPGEVADEEPEPEPLAAPQATEELQVAVIRLETATAEYNKRTKDAAAQASAIDIAYAPIPEQQFIIAVSAYEKGGQFVEALPEHASEETRNAFTVAHAALAVETLTEESDLTALVGAYVGAWSAVEASHDAELDRIHAQEAAAQEAAAQEAAAQEAAAQEAAAQEAAAQGSGQVPGPRGSLTRSGTCKGNGGSALGNWSSNLSAPVNARSVLVKSRPGVSWDITWTC